MLPKSRRGVRYKGRFTAALSPQNLMRSSVTRPLIYMYMYRFIKFLAGLHVTRSLDSENRFLMGHFRDNHPWLKSGVDLFCDDINDNQSTEIWLQWICHLFSRTCIYVSISVFVRHVGGRSSRFVVWATIEQQQQQQRNTSNPGKTVCFFSCLFVTRIGGSRKPSVFTSIWRTRSRCTEVPLLRHAVFLLWLSHSNKSNREITATFWFTLQGHKLTETFSIPF